MKKKEILEILDSYVGGLNEVLAVVRQAKQNPEILDNAEIGIIELMRLAKALYFRVKNEKLEEESEEEKAAEQVKGEEIEVKEE